MTFLLYVRENGATEFRLVDTADSIGVLVDRVVFPGAFTRCLWSIRTTSPAYGAVNEIQVVVANGYVLPAYTGKVDWPVPMNVKESAICAL